MESLIFVLAAVFVLLFMSLLLFYRKLIVLSVPGQLSVIKGRGDKDGKRRNYRLVTGERGLRIPVLETVETLDTTLIQVDVVAEDIRCADGKSVTITADVFASLSRMEPGVSAAVERFLDHSRTELKEMIDDTVVRCLQQGASKLNSADIHSDRTRFEMMVSEALFEELEPMGFVVRALCLQRIMDEAEELDLSPTPTHEATAVANPW